MSIPSQLPSLHLCMWGWYLVGPVVSMLIGMRVSCLKRNTPKRWPLGDALLSSPLLQGHWWLCHLVQEIQSPKASAQAPHAQPGHARPLTGPTQRAQVRLRHPHGQVGREATRLKSLSPTPQQRQPPRADTVQAGLSGLHATEERLHLRGIQSLWHLR